MVGSEESDLYQEFQLIIAGHGEGDNLSVGWIPAETAPRHVDSSKLYIGIPAVLVGSGGLFIVRHL